MRKTVITVAALVLALAFATACDVHPSYTFVVDSGSDAPDTDPGDGSCVATTGGCTLRAAVDEANAIAQGAIGPAPAFLVELVVDVTLSIPGATENLNATGDVDIQVGASSLVLAGAGHVIDAAELDRALHIATGSVRVAEVTIENGRTAATDLAPDAGGGAILTGNGTTLFVQRSVLRDNEAITFSACVAFFPPACTPNRIFGGGGAIQAEGALVVDQSTFVGNAAAPLFQTCEPAPRVTLCGMAWGAAILASGPMVVASSTFDDNTIVGRTDQGGTVVSGWSAGAYSATVATATVTDGSGEPSGWVEASSIGGSLLARTTCSNLAPDAAGNLVTQDPCVPGSPGLGPLANNGGWTPTRLPLAGSPVIDAITPLPDGSCSNLRVDQRGEPRPAGAACDAGAVERQPTDP